MRAGYVAIVLGLVGCSKAGTNPVEPPPTVSSTPSPAFKPSTPSPTPSPAKASGVTVQMTAATLADDCGGAAPSTPPASKAKSAAKADSADVRGAKAKRKCQQTSMQLSVVAAADAVPTVMKVKKVELFDETGASLGELVPRSPTVWSAASGAYGAWDEQIAPAQDLSVSYVLAQPAWGAVADRRNKTYVLKAVVTVGGSDHSVQQNVEISAPASLPANVKT